MWIWACVVPHPPIVVPEVGKGREKEAKPTLEGFLKLGKLLKKPEALVLLSPHAPFVPGKMLLVIAKSYKGSLEIFDAPSVFSEAPGLYEDALFLETLLEKERIPLKTLFCSEGLLDHGSMVPLYYLMQSWSSLPPLLVINPAGLSPVQAYDLGMALSDFLPSMKWGLVASGDLSHGVTPSAPGKYHPWGERFDGLVVECLEGGNPLPLKNLSPEERRDAQECGLASVLCALGLVKDRPFQILSYEAPFGVGYCVACHIPQTFEDNRKEA